LALNRAILALVAQMDVALLLPIFHSSFRARQVYGQSYPVLPTCNSHGLLI